MVINYQKTAKVSIIVIFIALIRSISEFYRLDYTLQNSFTIQIAEPFILAALICSVGLLLMTILFFYSRNKWIIATSVLVIVLMFIIKFSYNIP